MANRAVLISEPSFEQQLAGNPRVSFLRGSRNCIAVLWCGLFSSSDIRIRKIDDADGTPVQVPVLFTGTSKAQDRIRSRRSTFLKHFPAGCADLYDSWQRLINSVRDRYIELEGLEIFGLSPETYQDELLLYVRAYEEDDIVGWRALIEQAGLEFDEDRAMAIMGDIDIEEALLGYD